MSNEQFNPSKLFEAFEKSLRKTDHSSKEFDDIYLKEYLLAYHEINKFLECLGTVFYFVIVDIREKIDILENHLKSDPISFETIHTVIQHERSLNLLKPPHASKRQSATRHILRLHRALLFVYKFLDQLFKAEQKTKTSQICTETYDATLAKHHTWLVRKAATFGMLTLPKREILVGFMCKTSTDHENFPIFIQTIEKCYNITQEFYEKYQILDLP